MVNVNCVSMTNMCALVLPQMLEKNKGVIVNISSKAADGYVGGSTYAATKAYVSMLSECLQRTYNNTGNNSLTLQIPYIALMFSLIK